MTASLPDGERYTHGYHEAIIESYTRRTAERCAAFLLPRLNNDARVLDVGCGPGTITTGLAHRAREVVGVDASAEMVDAAGHHAADSGVENVTFEVGSAYDLPCEDCSFDVVYAHQVMQHLSDPVRALREARRVLRPGGLVAVRDSDYQTMVHAPVEPAIGHWLRLYHQVTAANGGEADAGRFLPGWVRAAGFVDPVVTASTTTYSDAAGRGLWGRLWAVRVTDSDFAQHAVSGGLATRGDLVAISAAFGRWADHPDGFWAFLNGEVVAVRPAA